MVLSKIDHTEIEVKYIILSCKDFLQVLSIFDSFKSLRIHNYYFDWPGRDKNMLRLRSVNKSWILTFKSNRDNNQAVDVRREIEFQISEEKANKLLKSGKLDRSYLEKLPIYIDKIRLIGENQVLRFITEYRGCEIALDYVKLNDGDQWFELEVEAASADLAASTAEYILTLSGVKAKKGHVSKFMRTIGLK